MDIQNPIGGFNLLQYFPFLAVFGVLAGFWQQTKSFLTKIFRIFWKKRSIPHKDISDLFYIELLKSGKVINFDDFSLDLMQMFSLDYNNYYPIFYKGYRLEILFYKKFIPIFITRKSVSLNISYLKYTFNFDKFFSSVLDKFKKREEHSISNRIGFYIEEYKGLSLKSIESLKNKTSEKQQASWSDSDPTSNSDTKDNNTTTLSMEAIKKYSLEGRIFNFHPKRLEWVPPFNMPKNKYIFTKQGLEIYNKVGKWLDAENWYRERNINFRYGVLLHGKPGTGKSSLILEIAKKVRIPLFIFDLSTFDNQEFCSELKNMSHSPAILLFEDIDNQFEGRKTLNKSDKYMGLTFDCFINKLSGVQSIENKFIFITTNHIEKLDPALIRKGRIDEIIELNNLNKEEKIKVASMILDNNESLITRVINEGENDTNAEFENRCVELALKKFWNKS